MSVITEGSKKKTDTGRTLTHTGHEDTVTGITKEQEYTAQPSLYDYDGTDNTYHHAKEHDTTTSVITDTEPSTADMSMKPRIVGGNAASFTVLSNSDAVLPCEAEGNPEPSISWRRFSSSTGTRIFELRPRETNGSIIVLDVFKTCS